MAKKSKSKSQEETTDIPSKSLPKPTVIVKQEMTMLPEAMDMLKKSVDIVVDEYAKTKLDNLAKESIDKYFGKLGTVPFYIKIVEEGFQEISLSDAKELILNTIDSGEIFYPSDIAERLNLDLKLVIEAINELKKEGRIKPAE